MWAWVLKVPSAAQYIAFSPYASDQAQNMFRALWSWLICTAIVIIVSLFTKPKTDAELEGLTFGASVIPTEGKFAWYKRSLFWAGVTTVVFVAINLYFW
jgi:SSS family solute:Na+ symporter